MIDIDQASILPVENDLQPMSEASWVAAMQEPLAIGTRAPGCFGMSSKRAFYSFEEQFGRPAVLILAGGETRNALAGVLDAFAGQLEAFADKGADVLLMVDENPALLLMPAHRDLPVRVIDCGDFLRRCGMGPADISVLVLDRMLRVASRQRLEGGMPRSAMEAIAISLACLDALPHEPARDVVLPAPVTILPHLLPLSMCRYLIDLFERSPTTEGMVARVDAAGNPANVIDHAKKHRRDLEIEPGTPLHDVLKQTLLGRCRPEIAKAYQVRVTQVDRILVSRYDETGGYFRRHRDNDAEQVMFREFALSVNLNTEDYSGGHLLFPEYNDHRYRPGTGAGVIFSASVLHEATPVTRGSRYVLLTFMHSDAAEERRRRRDRDAVARLTAQFEPA